MMAEPRDGESTLPTPLQPPAQRMMTRNEARHQKKQMKKLKGKINQLKFKESLAKRGYLGKEHIVSQPSLNDGDAIANLHKLAFDDPDPVVEETQHGYEEKQEETK